MDWQHANPVRIAAGVGTLARLPGLLDAGSRILLVTSAGFTQRGVTGRIRDMLAGIGCELDVLDRVLPNPELDALEAFAAEFQARPAHTLVALGGGSALDAGKILSVLLSAGGERALHRAFRLGEGQAWSARVPVIAIPTTAGTGAEVTPFATVWDSASQRKYSVAGDLLFPAHALLDAQLCLGLPADDTLYTALDAISHALESLWNRHRTPLSEGFALQALWLSSRALPRVLAQPGDLEQRAMLQHASLLAGLAIAQTRTALAHSISYPLTLRHGVPHGLACSFTLPALLAEYLPALEAQIGRGEVLRDILEVLRAVDFDAHLSRYATREQIFALREGMVTVGRADNFIFPADLDGLLARSLAADPAH